MHKKLVVFATLFCACSAISAFADPVAAAAYDKLKLSTNDWFSASVSGSKSTVTGGSIEAKTGADLTYENSKFVIDSDIDAPVTFTASNNRTNDIVMIDFDLDAAYVPVNLLASGDALKGVKIGFAISKDGDAKAFRAWVGGDWLTLTGATVPDDDYKVIIRLDGRDQKVQFEYVNVVNSVEERAILKSGDNEWIPYTNALKSDGSLSIDFVGSGAVTSFNGNQLNILAEVIVAGDVIVDVKEEDVAAFEATAKALGAASVGEFLAKSAQAAYSTAKFKDETLKVNQAYALGMLVKNNEGKMEPVNEGKLEIKATSAKVQNKAIAVGFANVTPRTDVGATFSYRLQGLSKTSGNWENVDGVPASSSMPSIPVSAVGTYDFFKVVTTVTFPSATK